ncbi:MAG TPA: hypothetical protein VGC41_04710, partial [Kofleriaceae bacterium]
VLDFGVAKLLEGAARSTLSQLSLTQAGMVFGTPEFMSPEQACGHPLDARSDLYSLAATMFAMLTGCGLFAAASAIEWLTAHVRVPAPHLVDGNPGLAGLEPLDHLIQKSLAKRPEDRYASADEMIAAIEAVERDIGLAPAAAPLPKIQSVFSPSAFIPALADAGSGVVTRASAPTIDPYPEPAPDSGPALLVATTTSNPAAFGETVPSRRGIYLVLGSLAVAGVIVAAIAIASSSKPPASRPVATKHPDAAIAAALIVEEAPPSDGPRTPDAGVVATPTPIPHHDRHSEFDEHIALALAAQKANKRMTQVTQAHAAYLLNPKNPEAVLLLADGLLAEGDLEHGCKYLHELARNPVAQQRMRSASCPD